MIAIRLRRLEEKDAKKMLEWMCDSEITRHFRTHFSEFTIDDILEFIRSSQQSKEDKHFAIVDEKDNYMGTVSLKNIDTINLHAEYAIVLHSNAVGQGYGKFATMDILKYAFCVLSLNKVYLNVLSTNINAINFYEHMGFKKQGEFEEHLYINDQFVGLKWYAFFSKDFNTLI